MNRLLALAAFLAAYCSCLAVDAVPEFSISDRYVTSPTMLVRMGADGRVREVWSGMDAGRRLHVPLFLETEVSAKVLVNGAWIDLRTLRYDRTGTRPGYIRMRSEDGVVSIEVTSRRGRGDAPVFVRYSFSRPLDFRIIARFKHPEFTKAFHSDNASGSSTFETLWRNVNSKIETAPGPPLSLATLPAGETLSIDASGTSKELKAASEVVLCIDATEPSLVPPKGTNYVSAWAARLGGLGDDTRDLAGGRVSLLSGDPKLDRMFESSVDAIETHQFASGDVMADVFFYRDSWLRDGTYSMIGLALAGDFQAVDRYFDFWSSQRDFSVGGEREAQQAAIAITGMWFYSRMNPDGNAFLGRMWPYMRYYADYFAGRVEKEGMLHLAEEWICFIPAPSSWPNAEVYSGLRAAAKAALALGHTADGARWNAAADRLRERFRSQAYDPMAARIIPMAGAPGEAFRDSDYPKAESRNGPMRDERVDAGMLIIGRLDAFGRDQSIIPVDDPMFASTQAQVQRDLENPDHSVMRFGPNPSSPHAPKGELDSWPIINAWAAQDQWLLGHTDLGWRYLLSGVVNKAGYNAERSAYYLPEFWDKAGVPDKQLIVWSHGDFVTSVLLLFLGIDLEAKGADLGLAPSLPPGMDHARIDNFHFRSWHLDFELNRAGAQVDVKVRARSQQGDAASLSIRLPSGKVLVIASGTQDRFTVDPTQYFSQLGHGAHAQERAAILSRVLAGREPPQDLGRMSPEQLEDFMGSLVSQGPQGPK